MTQNDTDDLPRRIGDLLENAERYNSQGSFANAAVLVDEARLLAAGNIQASAEIDLFCCDCIARKRATRRRAPIPRVDTDEVRELAENPGRTIRVRSRSDTKSFLADAR